MTPKSLRPKSLGPKSLGPKSLNVVLTAALAAGLVFGLAACGKKGAPKPPAGQESEYKYPNPYPAPGTVVKGASDEPGEGDDPFWIFTDGDEKRTKTKTY